jgi:hypothetical protein
VSTPWWFSTLRSRANPLRPAGCAMTKSCPPTATHGFPVPLRATLRAAKGDQGERDGELLPGVDGEQRRSPLSLRTGWQGEVLRKPAGRAVVALTPGWSPDAREKGANRRPAPHISASPRRTRYDHPAQQAPLPLRGRGERGWVRVLRLPQLAGTRRDGTHRRLSSFRTPSWSCWRAVAHPGR